MWPHETGEGRDSGDECDGAERENDLSAGERLIALKRKSDGWGERRWRGVSQAFSAQSQESGFEFSDLCVDLFDRALVGWLHRLDGALLEAAGRHLSVPAWRLVQGALKAAFEGESEVKREPAACLMSARGCCGTDGSMRDPF